MGYDYQGLIVFDVSDLLVDHSNYPMGDLHAGLTATWSNI
jgi:hypothetical protein